MSTKEEQKIKKNVLLHFLIFSQNVEFFTFPRAKCEHPVLLFPRIKQPDARKRRSAKQGRIQEEENTMMMHVNHASSHTDIFKKPFKISEITDITEYVILRCFSRCLIYLFGGLSVQPNLSCSNYSAV